WSAILDGLFMTDSVEVVNIRSTNSVSGISLSSAITCQVMRRASILRWSGRSGIHINAAL
ncbi:MAG: hypothetical protein QOE55_4646, partial [Acidobacteriaceae bacterium]|nr:hypothetical protein [Acidobacteriaceae bacterium]